MTRPDDHRPGQGDDPVDRFFAAQRSQVHDQPGDDLHWQGIVRSARAQRRSRFRGYAAGVAAAVVVLGSVATGSALTRHTEAPSTSSTAATSTASPTTTSAAPLPQQSHAVSPTSPAKRVRSGSPTRSSASVVPVTPVTPVTPVRPTMPPPSPRTTPRSLPVGPPPGLVPAYFAATSISNAGKGVLYVLGSAHCGASAAARCATLARSGDDGATWADLQTFPEGSGLTQVRFANPTTGWAFGGSGGGVGGGNGVLMTRDGGRSWRSYPHAGDSVLSLETDGRTVYLATATGCGAQGCSGPVAVSSASVGASGARSVTGHTGARVPILSGRLALDGSVPYLAAAQAAVPATVGVAGPARVDASGLTTLPLPVACGTAGPGATFDVVTTASSPGTVFGVCPVDAGAGSVGYAVGVSSDAGQSWKDRAATLRLPNGGQRSFAAADASHLVAASGGGAGAGSLQVSRDGGTTWTAAHVAHPPVAGWSWVGAAGGGTYEALSAGSDPAFWRSTDLGTTWRRVAVH